MKLSLVVFLLGILFCPDAWTSGFFLDKLKVQIPPLPQLEVDPASYENLLNQLSSQCDSKSNDCSSWIDILRAKLWVLRNKKQACGKFIELTKNQTHPLYPLFLIKQSETCKFNKTQQATLTRVIEDFITKEKPNGWLEGPLRQAQVKLGAKDQILPLSHLLLTKREKEALLLQGVRDPLIPLQERVKIKRELWRISPRFMPKGLLAKEHDFISAAQDALNANDGATALKFSKKAVAEDSKRALEIEKAALKMLQEKKEALKVGKKIFQLDFATFIKDKSLANGRTLLNSGLNYTRALWTNHDTVSANSTLKKMEKVLRSHYPLSEIYFLKARLAEEEGDLEQALKFLEIANQELPPGKTENKQSKNLYLWNEGWFHFKKSQMAEAADVFSKIETTDNIDSGKKLQAMFWLAKSQQALNLKKDAEKKFRAVIDEDPTSYYAFLSYRELQEKIPAVHTDPPEELSAPSSFNLILFRWLVLVGEFKLAQNMLQQELPLKDSYVSDWPGLFPLYKEAHAFAPVFIKVIRLPQKDKVKMTTRNMDVLFPITNSDSVQMAAAETGLWPEYIYSIIRQESSFDNQALSPADAIGLMQLIPSAAKFQAKKHKIEFKTKDDLFDPGLNIKLGSFHLRDYWEMFDGKFIFATAGYNASPEAVKTWMKTRHNDDPLIFIEDIPYEETRNYVKLVLRNFINYMRLTTKESAIEFPEWTLAL